MIYHFPHVVFALQRVEGEAAGIMGDEIRADSGVTLQVFLPSFAEIRLINNLGKSVRTIKNAQALTHITQEPGVYTEAFRNYLGESAVGFQVQFIYVSTVVDIIEVPLNDIYPCSHKIDEINVIKPAIKEELKIALPLSTQSRNVP